MLAAAVTAKIEIPRIILFVKSEFVESAKKIIKSFFSLASADYLAYSGNEKVSRGNGLAVVVQSHIKRLYILRIVRYENRLFVNRFGEVSFVFRLQVAAPRDGIFKLIVVLFENLDRFGVSYANEVGLDNAFKSFDKSLVNKIVEELHLQFSIT